MAIDPVTGMLAGSVLSAGAGIWGSNQAANAQEQAAKQAAETARRNLLMQIQLNEPNRFLGYQAQGDIASALGYSQAPYTTPQQLQQTLTKLGAKEVKAGLRNGLGVDQLAQMGTLGDLNAKQLKRLTRAGLTPQDIQRLQSGGMSNAAPPSVAPGATGGTQNFSRFYDSPDYQFRVSEGQRDIGNTFAARGGAASGNALRALTEFNQNLAASEFGNWFNRRAGLAGMGTQASGNVGQAGQNTANSLMASQQAQGDARASGIMGGVNSAANAINAGTNNYLLSKYLSPQVPQTNSPFGPYAGGYNFPTGAPPTLPTGTAPQQSWFSNYLAGR